MFWILAAIAVVFGVGCAAMSISVTNAAHNAAAELERQRRERVAAAAKPAPPPQTARQSTNQTAKQLPGLGGATEIRTVEIVTNGPA